jgi:hypothetical protein
VTDTISFSHPLTEAHTAARYRVEGWAGVAVRIKGWTQEAVNEPDYLICDEGACDHESVECYVEGDTYTVDGEMLRVVMVGDDREHIVDPADLIVIDDEDYCHSCGQLGCTHDGR